MLLLKRLFCAVFAVFFTLNAWADYTISGSALCDGSQANNADLSIGFSVLPDDMDITGTFDYIPGSSSDIVVDFGMAYPGDEDAFSSVTLQDIQDYLINDRPSYFAQNNAVVRCQFLNPGYEEILWNNSLDVLVNLYGLDSPGGSMKWLNAFSFTPGTNQCWFFGNREIDCSMTLADVAYLYRDSLENIDQRGFLPGLINQYIEDPVGFMGDNDRDPHALSEQLGFEPQDTCIRRRVSCYIIPQDNTCSKDQYPMTVSAPDTLLYMDGFEPYSNKILMQKPDDIPWHMVELLEGDAVVLAAVDPAVSMSNVDLSDGTWRDTNALLPIAIAAQDSGYINFVRNAYGVADWVSSTNDGEFMNDTRFTNLLKDYNGDFSDNVSDYIEDIQLAFTEMPGDYWCPMGSTYSSGTDNVWAICSALNLNDGICKQQIDAAFTADSGDFFALLPVELNDTPTECPSGYYGDGATCTKCPAGSYCPSGATVPFSCPAGSYCAAGATAPTACPANSTSVAGSAACTCKNHFTVTGLAGGATTTTTNACQLVPTFAIRTLNIPKTGTFSFELNALGTFYVDWGDDTPIQTITRTSAGDQTTFTHTYNSMGERIIEFAGQATDYPDGAPVISFAGNTDIVEVMGSLGSMFPVAKSLMFYRTFKDCNELSTVPDGLFSGIRGAAENMFAYTFQNCDALEVIPGGLFSGITGAEEHMFEGTFYECSSLEIVEDGLFDNIIGAADWLFNGTFFGCTELKVIPDNLFAGVQGAAAHMFHTTFKGCSSLETFSEDLFGNVSGAAEGLFYMTFQNCSMLSSIPGGVFRNISGSANEMFYKTFADCSALTEIPSDLFESVDSASAYMFHATFNNCTSLSVLPDGLFKNISSMTGNPFISTFQGCRALSGYVPVDMFQSLNADDFTAGQMSNIFASTGLDTVCPEGTYQYITGFESDWSNKVSCAPDGPTPEFFVTTTEMAGNTVFEFRLDTPGTFYINWGDGSLIETIEKTAVGANDDPISHTYKNGGEYTITIAGQATGQYTYPSGTNAVISFAGNTNVASVDGSLGPLFPVFGESAPAFQKIFEGCTNLTTIPSTLFTGITKSAPHQFRAAFKDCTSLTEIPDLLFADLNDDATENQFREVFQNCTGLTGIIPPALFAGAKGNMGYAMFAYAFDGCSGLSGEIPVSLFAGINGNGSQWGFAYTFSNCSQLTGMIPGGLFDGVKSSAAQLFYSTFYNCSGLTAIPPALFAYAQGNAQKQMFTTTFYGCSGLDGEIPGDLFPVLTGDPAEELFNCTFCNCSGLDGEIPGNLFAGVSGDVQARSFQRTFFGCSGLSGEIPGNLFSTITGAPQEKSFSQTFDGASGLTGTVPTTLFAGLDNADYASGPMQYVFYGTGLATSCPAGEYQYMTGFEVDFNGKVACTPCPDSHPLSNAGAVSQTECYAKCLDSEIPGGFIKPVNTTVAYPGTCQYAATSINCSAGYYTDWLTVDQCFICPAGSYCAGGGASPVECPSGSYCPEGASSPEACPANSSTNGATGAVHCKCNVGYTVGGFAGGDIETTEFACSEIQYEVVYWPTNSGPYLGDSPFGGSGDSVYYSDNVYQIAASDRIGVLSEGRRLKEWAVVGDSQTRYEPGETIAVTSSLWLYPIYECDAGYYGDGTTCTICPDNSGSYESYGPDQEEKSGMSSCICDYGYSADGNITGATVAPERGCAEMTYGVGYWITSSGPPNVDYRIPFGETDTLLTASDSRFAQYARDGYVLSKWRDRKDATNSRLFDPGQVISVSDLLPDSTWLELVPVYTCAAGYYGDGTTCTVCPVDSFCAEGATEPTACPENSSTRGSTGNVACSCDDGFTTTGTSTGSYITTGDACLPMSAQVTYYPYKGAHGLTSLRDYVKTNEIYTISTGTEKFPARADGYVFENWVNMNGESQTYNPGETISGLDLLGMQNQGLILYGVWHCAAGYYGDGNTCTVCPAGSYCPESVTSPTVCPAGYTSDAGATQDSGCYLTTTAGKYVANEGAKQTTCPADYYCAGGVKVIYGDTGGATRCLANSSTNGVTGATSASACYCDEWFTTDGTATGGNQPAVGSLGCGLVPEFEITVDMKGYSSFPVTITAGGKFCVQYWGANDRDCFENTTGNAQTFYYTYPPISEATIKITGNATGYDSTQPAIMFGSPARIKSIRGSLGAVFPTVNGQSPRFDGLFAGATRVTEIPDGLFDGITTSAPSQFASTFSGMTGLTSIPGDLFSGITGEPAQNAFASTFSSCSNLSSVGGKNYLTLAFFGSLTEPVTYNSNMFMGTFAGTGLASSCPNGYENPNPYYAGNIAKAVCEPYYSVNYFAGNSGAPIYYPRLSYGKSLTVWGNLPTDEYQTTTWPAAGYVLSHWKEPSTNQIYNIGDTLNYADVTENLVLRPVFVCAAGYYGDGATCTVCPAGSYCPSGATTPTTCPANSYCPEGAIAPTTCPKNSTSVAGSAVCTCNAGHSVGGDKTTTTTAGAACVANTYTVTLDANGGTGGSTSVTATYDSAMPSATMPTRSGYTFAGYYDAKTGGNQYYTASGGSAKAWNKASAATLYARWTANEYVVKFDANGGSGEMSDQNRIYDDGVKLSANTFTRTGYTFAGWNTVASGSGVAYANQATDNLTTVANSEVLLYAQWTVNSYKCDAGYYLKKAAVSCSKCSAGYYCPGGTYKYNETKNQGISSCTGRTKYSAAGASKCSVVSTGYYTTSCNTSGNLCKGQSQCGAGNYCVAGVQNSCASGLTTIGYGAGADEVADCGIILHAGEGDLYLRSGKKTEHALHVKKNGSMFYGNMSTSSKNMNINTTKKLKVKYNGTTYYVYDDSVQ